MRNDDRWKTLNIVGIQIQYLPWKYLPVKNKILTIVGAVVIAMALIMMLRE